MSVRSEDMSQEDTITTPDLQPLEVSVDDIDDADEPTEAQAKEAGLTKDKGARDAKGRWSEKKAERGENRRRLRDDHEDLKGKYTAMEAKLASLEEGSRRERETFLAALAAGRGNQQGGQQSQQQTATADIDGQIKDVNQQLQSELELLARDNNRTIDRYNALNEKKIELIADRRAMAKGWGAQQQREQGPTVNPVHSARIVQLEVEFPWIHTNPKAAQQVGTYRRTLMEAGRADNIETDREACAHVARVFSISRSAAPSQRTQQAFGGAPSGARGGPGPKRMQIDPRLVQGSGLSQSQLASALFNKEEE